MNHLAHAYLSFKEPGLLVGNLAGDFIKGNQYLQYPEAIQLGVLMHRHIDTFTDAHPIVLDAKKVFRESVGRYDGAFLDIAYDYFLANAPNVLSENDWRTFTSQTYSTVALHIENMPTAFQRMFSYMENGDWLYNYRFESQIQRSFNGLARRAQYLNDNVNPFKDFESNKTFLQQSFAAFFPELQTFAKDWIAKNHISLH
ncbi:MAG: ACP phosphodiesterase [Chitinophagaceae bacterium]